MIGCCSDSLVLFLFLLFLAFIFLLALSIQSFFTPSTSFFLFLSPVFNPSILLPLSFFFISVRSLLTPSTSLPFIFFFYSSFLLHFFLLYLFPYILFFLPSSSPLSTFSSLVFRHSQRPPFSSFFNRMRQSSVLKQTIYPTPEGCGTLGLTDKLIGRTVCKVDLADRMVTRYMRRAGCRREV